MHILNDKIILLKNTFEKIEIEYKNINLVIFTNDYNYILTNYSVISNQEKYTVFCLQNNKIIYKANIKIENEKEKKSLLTIDFKHKNINFEDYYMTDNSVKKNKEDIPYSDQEIEAIGKLEKALGLQDDYFLNSVIKRYYVYVWYIKSTGEIFYVGRGTKNRFKVIKDRNNNFLAKYNENENDCEVMKIITNLTREVATKLEAAIIDVFKESGYNITNILSGIKNGY